MKGVCVISGDVYGFVEFIQDKPDHLMRIVGSLNNLSKGHHGIHVHEFGDVSNGCTSAGEHFNPHNENHGGPMDTHRHLGDLGNVYSEGERYVTEVNIVDPMISLYGPHNILGRCVVVHAMEDDFGRGDNELSKITGNAGSRLGCGIIGVKNEPIVTF
ncbi:MAG: sod [Betabaculovirus sp.]|nr:MAG: sod [Betabaculovirus sp.]